MTKNFCSEYIALNSVTEIPPTFTAWCALSAVSSVLARRVWIDMGPFKIFPNMFIILVAGSGQMRKSTAISVTRNLLKQMTPHPNIISQKLTPEALLDAMKISSVAMEPTKIKVGADNAPIGQGFVITDELTNFLNRTTNDGGIVPMLIEFYDCQDPFSYRTKARGEEILRETQLSLLAATTPEELRKAIPEDVIGSGLASRILFVYETRPAPPIAFPTYGLKELEAKEYCLRFLSRAMMLSGEIKLSPECRAWCTECYTTRCYNNPLLDDPHLRGYASRRYVHILKLAINLAVGLTETTTITVDILKKAEDLVQWNEANLSKIVQLVTMNEKGTIINVVFNAIKRHKEISRENLLRTMNHRLDSRELNEVLETLVKSNQISITARGAQIIYSIK